MNTSDEKFICKGQCNICTNECFDRINPPHWPMETTVVMEDDEGNVGERTIANIRHGRFLVDQLFGFQVNEGKDESLTVHRCRIPRGTPVEEGYKAVRDFIEYICKKDPVEVLRDLGFYDVIGEMPPQEEE